jgi:hypothetical protein
MITLEIKILMRYAVPLQAGRSQVPFPLGSLEFFIYLILRPQYGQKSNDPLIEIRSRGIYWGINVVGA